MNGYLYNLSSTEIQRQNLQAQGVYNSGRNQTYNHLDHGPTFGGGRDISVDSGDVRNNTYGGTTYYDNILTGGARYHGGLDYGEIEVYSIENVTNAAVPEPSTYVVFTGLILSFALAGWWRKRKRGT